MGNILNKVPEKGTETNLFVLAGDEEAQTPFGWDDMPEFDQPEKGQYALIRVRFRNEEDLREFAEKIDQTNITTKTKAIWYPPLEKNSATVLKCVEDGSIRLSEGNQRNKRRHHADFSR